MGKDLIGKELGTGIRQLPNGKYSGRYVDKFGKRKELYDWDLQKLRKRLNVALFEVQTDNCLVDETTTLDKWFDQWLNVHKYNVIGPNTRRHYIYVYEDLIKPKLGFRKLSQITQLDIKSLLRSLDEQNYGFSSKDRVRIILLDMFNKAMIDNFVHRNPVRGIRIPHDHEEPRVLTEEEQILFFDTCKGTFYDNLFVTAVNTGLRQGELAALTWEDIDFDKKEISVNKTLVYQQYEDDEKKTFHVGPPKTASSNRTVPMNRQCETALKKQFLLRNNVWSRDCVRKNEECGDLVFVTRMGAPLCAENFCDAIRAILKIVNEFRDPLEQIADFSSHCFRHTFATRCFEAGVSPKTVQNILGHASISMTMDLYTHILDKHKVDEMGKIQEEFDKLDSKADQFADLQFEEAVSRQMNENRRNPVDIPVVRRGRAS